MNSSTLLKNLFNNNKNITTLKYALNHNVYQQSKYSLIATSTQIESKKIDQIMAGSKNHDMGLIVRQTTLFGSLFDDIKKLLFTNFAQLIN